MSKREELFQRKRRAMELMDEGVPWQEANEQSGLNYSRRGIQGLYREWDKRGDEALIDQRHGHPHKATAGVRERMRERCEEEPEIRASRLTAEIKAEFGVELHHDYVGLLRRQLGLPVPKVGRPSKRQAREPAPEKELEQDFPPSGG
jgi:transposase